MFLLFGGGSCDEQGVVLSDVWGRQGSLSGTNVDDGALMLPDVITAAPRHITGRGCPGLHVAGATRGPTALHNSSEVEPLLLK